MAKYFIFFFIVYLFVGVFAGAAEGATNLSAVDNATQELIPPSGLGIFDLGDWSSWLSSTKSAILLDYPSVFYGDWAIIRYILLMFGLGGFIMIALNVFSIVRGGGASSG